MPICEHDRRVGHQVAYVAHEQQAAAWQSHCSTVGAGPFPIGFERAGHGLATLGEVRDEIAAHQAQPVAVGERLVLGIDRSDRIFEIDDRGQRGLEHDVGHASLVGAPHRVFAVQHQLYM